jgi:ATP-dependent Lon protease
MSSEIGIFALGAVLSPGELLPLHVFEERYKELVSECIAQDRPFLVLYSDDQGTRELGCTANVVEVLDRFEDGRMNVVVKGGGLVTVVRLTRGRPYATAVVEPVVDDLDAGDERDAALAIFREFAAAAGIEAPDDLDDATAPLSYAIMTRVDFPPAEKQDVLELRSESSRLMALIELLARGMQALQKVEEIRKRAQGNGKMPLREPPAPD